MLSAEAMTIRERRISDAVRRESSRLRNFIRTRVPNEDDVEDVLQDVFSELVEVQSQLEPIRQVGAWLFRVARNRIIDRFRKQPPQTVRIEADVHEEDQDVLLEDWLPSDRGSPEAAYARGILLDEMVAALEELPHEQSEIFVAHELEGHSFKELADETGLSV
ncbi:MAG: sigma-70 family RNA polymerase sigma factor, partial [SAR324 cluster bacterium]|nr:sigma-70 family RNA polymerase sigma factor [SAR324 cluster bacterium]